MYSKITGIENQEWAKRIDASVDPQFALDIESFLLTDEDGAQALEVTVSGNAGGAGLVSTDVDLPLVRGVPLQYVKTTWLVKPSIAAAENNERLELDTIPIFPGALSNAPQQNHYNGSIQLNYSEAGGTFDDGNWTSTGVQLGLPAADVWSTLVIIYKLDYTAKIITDLSISLNGKAVQVPATAATFPADTTNWGLYIGGAGPFSFTHLQIQLKLRQSGACAVRYRVNVEYADDLSLLGS